MCERHAESGFYYLNSRYYDPQMGRFINADVFASTGQGFLGCNMFAYCNNNPVNSEDPSGKAEMDATRPWVTGEGVAGLYIVPWQGDCSYGFGDFLLDLVGPIEIDFSAVCGLCIMLEGAISFIVDDYGNIALVLSPGIGGGLGSSVGLGSTTYPGKIDVNTIAGVATKVGGSIICLGFEMDDKGSYSATIWRPKLGADFHATINYSWVIILWDGEKS